MKTSSASYSFYFVIFGAVSFLVGCSFDASLIQLSSKDKIGVKLEQGSFIAPASTPYRKLASNDGYEFKSSGGGLVNNFSATTEDGYYVMLTNQSVLISIDAENSPTP